MSEPIDDGGNAFPVSVSVTAAPSNDIYHLHQVVRDSGGMSLRDYFAAKAMQAAISNQEWFEAISKEGKRRGLELSEAVAKSAFEFADAMLKQRSAQ